MVGYLKLRKCSIAINGSDATTSVSIKIVFCMLLIAWLLEINFKYVFASTRVIRCAIVKNIDYYSVYEIVSVSKR